MINASLSTQPHPNPSSPCHSSSKTCSSHLHPSPHPPMAHTQNIPSPLFSPAPKNCPPKDKYPEKCPSPIAMNNGAFKNNFTTISYRWDCGCSLGIPSNEFLCSWVGKALVFSFSSADLDD